MPKDAHNSPTGGGLEPLYDTAVATPTHAESARTLAAGTRTGTLCTLALDPPGHPYGSLVTVGFHRGNPIFLISELAEHTKNLRSDPRASLLIAESEQEDPLANARLTLIGECRPVAQDSQGQRVAFLATHPNAAYYADFKDFAFWELDVRSLRYIGGYGRMSWVRREDWFSAEPDPIAPHAAGILEHMNADHAEALVTFCRAFSRATDVESASMTAVDRYGFEMSAVTPEGPRPIRLPFSATVSDAQQVRQSLIAMLEDARERLAAL